jgi:hypothetical protein
VNGDFNGPVQIRLIGRRSVENHNAFSHSGQMCPLAILARHRRVKRLEQGTDAMVAGNIGGATNITYSAVRTYFAELRR